MEPTGYAAASPNEEEQIAQLRAALRNSELVRAATYEHALTLEEALEQCNKQREYSERQLKKIREKHEEALETITNMLSSDSWRIGQTLVAPIRWVRRLRGQGTDDDAAASLQIP
ncbi:MAG: hypothetical protein FWG25_11105 [Promicromonosporaceae bacterium]|nr:hypothetical protein [Promicromonosporaceae bacterium]